MWVCFNNGFVSIVEDKPTGLFKVRARKKEHLLRLFPGEKIVTSKDTDYRYRVFVSKETVAQVVADRILKIDYPNFKNSVRDDGLHYVYAKFWDLHYRYQNYPGL